MTNAMISQPKDSAQAQTERLRKYLAAGNPINPLEAWRELGIYRLSARVFDLREAGVEIEGQFIEVRNQFGEKCRVKQYLMRGVNQ